LATYDTWGGSWGTSWGLSWTRSDTPPVPPSPPSGVSGRTKGYSKKRELRLRFDERPRESTADIIKARLRENYPEIRPKTQDVDVPKKALVVKVDAAAVEAMRVEERRLSIEKYNNHIIAIILMAEE